MNNTALALCKELEGAKFAFVQSDEISILLTDFERPETQAFFDNNLQKMCSISASVTTANFNELRLYRLLKETKGDNIVGDALDDWKLAQFDSRVFQIPQMIEVANYFIWRQQDWTRNSIQAVAQSMYSHSELNGKNVSDMQEMIFQKGTNWNDLMPRYKRGRLVYKNPLTTWEVDNDIPIFTKNIEYLFELIPDVNQRELLTS